jgi:hypothetical protein
MELKVEETWEATRMRRGRKGKDRGTRHGKEKRQKRKGSGRGRRERQKGKREGESMQRTALEMVEANQRKRQYSRHITVTPSLV